jgi:hypothetical protein
VLSTQQEEQTVVDPGNGVAYLHMAVPNARISKLLRKYLHATRRTKLGLARVHTEALSPHPQAWSRICP